MRVKSTGAPVYFVVLMPAGYKHFCVSSEPVDVPECAELTELLAHGRLAVVQSAASEAAGNGASEPRRRKTARRR